MATGKRARRRGACRGSVGRASGLMVSKAHAEDAKKGEQVEEVSMSLRNFGEEHVSCRRSFGDVTVLLPRTGICADSAAIYMAGGGPRRRGWLETHLK